MLIIIKILFLSNFCLFSQWEEINSPIGRLSVENIFYSDSLMITYNNEESFFTNNDWVDYYQINFEGIDSIGTLRNAFKYNNDIYIVYSTGVIPKRYGGVYKSTDNGYSWNLIDKSTKDSNFYTYFIKNSNSYFLTNNGFFKKEINYDQININSGFDKDDNLILMNANLMYFIQNKIILIDKGANGSSGQTGNGVFISEDDGTSFYQYNHGLNDKIINTFYSVGDTLLLGTPNGLYITKDSTFSWKQFNNGLIDKNIASIIYINNILFISTKNGIIYKSNNFGENWEKIFDNNKKGKILLTKYKNQIYLYSISGVYKSINYGESWDEIPAFIKSANSDLINSENNLFMLTYYSGIFKKNENSNEWLKLNDSLFSIDFDQTFIHKDGQNIITSSISNFESFLSTNNGANWSKNNISSGDLRAFNVFINNNRFFILTINKGIFYSDNNGQTWHNWNELHNENYIFKDIISYQNKLYGCTNGDGILYSEDNGENWLKINKNSNDLINNEFVFRVDKYDNIIVAATRFNKLLISRDNGHTWESTMFSTQNIIVNEVICYKNNIFIATSEGIYYSKNNGYDWIRNNININDKDFSLIRGFVQLKDKIIISFYKDIYQLSLKDLDIEYVPVDNVEKRSFLYIKPPFPLPSSSLINFHVYWDLGFNFNDSNIEIFNLNQKKIDVSGKINIKYLSNIEGIITWDSSKENNGIYIVKINQGSETRIQKVMVQK